MIELESMEIDPTTEAEEVQEVKRGFYAEGAKIQLKVCLSKRPFKVVRNAYVTLGEAWLLQLSKANFIKIGWVSCRVHRKSVADQCYRYLGFGHVVANCGGPD